MPKQIRLQVVDRRDEFSVFDMSGRTPEELALLFSEISDGYAPEILGKGYTVKFTAEPYGYDGGCEYYWTVYRDENNEEYAARMEQERKAREKAAKIREAKKEKARAALFKNEEAERAEYERLKAKFGE